jgi:hypothetical protein
MQLLQENPTPKVDANKQFTEAFKAKSNDLTFQQNLLDPSESLVAFGKDGQFPDISATPIDNHIAIVVHKNTTSTIFWVHNSWIVNVRLESKSHRDLLLATTVALH